MTDTFHALDLMWTMLAIGGGAFSIMNVYEAWIDKQTLPKDGRRAHAIVAAVAVRVEIARLGIQAIFAAIGIAAMTLTNAPADLPVRQGIARVAIEWGLIVAAALVAYQSVENRRMRVLLLGERKD